MNTPLRGIVAGLLLTVLGSTLAGWIQTGGGAIDVRDVRFMDTGGKPLAGLLYVPDSATADHPAPAILAVHGYINSRETQSPFAIEFARRGYVVLALDQRGHGFSAPPAFAAGFGGPQGLAYLRSLPFVDVEHIGLEGHSMGGWAVLAAAASNPDGYSAVVLEGSATGTFGAPEGTADFPRNVAVVFSRWDEFSELMWGVPRGVDVGSSAKLQQLFATSDPVVEGRLYGDIEAGTARRLHVPHTTHPGDHLSSAAVHDALGWFDATLGTPAPRDSQVWLWKEFSTFLALVGAIVTMVFTSLWVAGRCNFIGPPAASASPGVRTAWVAVLMFTVPVVSYFPSFVASDVFIAPNAFWPQQITNGLMVWLVVNGAFSAALLTLHNGWRVLRFDRVLAAVGTALASVGSTYLLLWLAERATTVDFRFWVVALKPLAAWHVPALLAYLPVLVGYFVIAGTAAVPWIEGMSTARAAMRLGALTCGGFVLLLLVQYVPLLLDHPLPLGQPLLTIVAYQFVVLLGIVAVVTAALYRATGSVLPGALLNALFVGWVVVAGTATHAG